MISRKEYMEASREDGQKAHAEYYEQFSALPFYWIKHYPSWQHIVEKARKSTDRHLNDIPLKEWDNLMPIPIPYQLGTLVQSCGDYITAAGWVCIAKCAVLKYIRENPEEVMNNES